MQSTFFRKNRYNFSQSVHGGVAVFAAYAQMQRGNDMAHAFEQEANFWWLTGIESADWWLIIDGTRGKSWLVAPQISESHQIFDGSLGAGDAIEISGVDAVISHDEAMTLLRDLSKKHSVAYALGEQPHAEHLDFTLNPAIKAVRDVVSRIFNSVQDCRKELAQLRAIKQPDEIIAMKKAINVTINAFERVKKQLPDCTHEYHIEAEFSHYFRTHGARGHAYDPIVAAGKNACTLHYTANSQKLKKQQLILLDIGVRMSGYAADITRTYAYGEPTKRQVQVHYAVQSAQREIIALLQPNLSVEQYQRDVDAIMTEALMGLDLMASRDDMASFRKYFPHAISHGLGVDVHDSLGGPAFLQPGMVLTVEPGIYIPEEGIGVRIEDDILITPTGHTNLSGHLSTDL
ncbi:MAG TPA: Xaa-Pro aminopeptidase [Candidatus Saccharimonadales bacterium]|nr:Xaa-Pro aminopeptidase [Candidatus Saccharimonadales bacterium]